MEQLPPSQFETASAAKLETAVHSDLPASAETSPANIVINAPREEPTNYALQRGIGLSRGMANM